MQIIAHHPARFADLPGYPFAENWLTIDLGKGPKDAPLLAGARAFPQLLPKCGHFSQEDRPEALPRGVIDMARKAGFQP